MPVGTSLTNLTAYFDLSRGASASAGGVNQISGVTKNDFTKPLEYLVTGESGSTKVWKVTVAYVGTDGTQSGSHTAYIHGYPGNTFRPISSIKRSEIAAMLSRVTTGDAGPDPVIYTDTAAHWARQEIYRVTRLGIMNGYPDGTFRPENTITRGEMADIIAKWLRLTEGGQTPLKDISGHWAQGSIEKVYKSGIMQGYPDGTFKPDKPLSRAEAVVIINKILGRGPLNTGSKQTWPDVPASHWAVDDIEEASVNHEYTRNPLGAEQIKK
jgi:hypothetical protein